MEVKGTIVDLKIRPDPYCEGDKTAHFQCRSWLLVPCLALLSARGSQCGSDPAPRYSLLEPASSLLQRALQQEEHSCHADRRDKANAHAHYAQPHPMKHPFRDGLDVLNHYQLAMCAGFYFRVSGAAGQELSLNIVNAGEAR